MKKRIRCALCLLLAAPAAHAFDSVDTLPYTFTGIYPAYPAEGIRPFSAYAEAGYEYDSNPFRFSSSLPRDSDQVLRYGGGARYNARVVGRQSILLEGRADYYDYQKSDVLDHWAYDVLGEWQWELTNSLSGALGGEHTFRIADPSQVQRETRQDVTLDRAYWNGAYRFAADWRLRGALEGDKAQRQRPGLASVETSSTTVRAGIDYVTQLANTFGVEYRESKGDAPVSDLVDPTGAFIGNDYREKEVAAVVSYGATSQFRVGGRLGHTDRTYTLLTDRDFSGTTWNMLLEWLPGNKTILGFETYKAPQSFIDVDASHVIVHGNAFTVSWAPLAKVVFSGRLFEERRQAVGTADEVLLGLPLRDETVHGYRVGAGWEPLRFWQVGLGYEHNERTSNVLLRDYKDDLVSLNVRYRF
jgi:opacity protein-like surface antigen